MAPAVGIRMRSNILRIWCLHTGAIYSDASEVRMGGTTAFMDNFAYDGGDIKRSDNANEQHTPVHCKIPDYGLQTTYYSNPNS